MEALLKKYSRAIDTCDVGGHSDFEEEKGGLLLKGITHIKEKKFYEEEAVKEEWKGLVPKYYGYKVIDNEGFIEMENLEYKYKKPHILDVKMGCTTWCEDVPIEKKEVRAELDKTTTSHSLGFRFCGMRTSEMIVSDKLHLDLHSIEEFEHVLGVFMKNSGERRNEMIDFYISQMEKIREAVRKSGCRFFLSSVLFLYDPVSGLYDCRFIDFSHYFDMKTHISETEDGVVDGIRTLEKAFRSVKL